MSESGAPGDAEVVSTGPRTALRIVKILKYITEHPDGVSLAQLSVGLRAPKTSLFSLVRSLADGDYLAYADGRYQLGTAAFALGSAIVARRRFPDVAMPIIRKLADETGETTFISELVPQDGQAVYVARAESRNPIRFMAEIGERRPLYSSSGGRVLLAFQTPEWQEAYLRWVKIVAHTPYTVVEKAKLRQILKDIRDTGLCRTHQDVHEGVSAFAAPIFNRDGDVIAALALASPTSRAEQKADMLSDRVKEAAAAVSGVLGYHP